MPDHRIYENILESITDGFLALDENFRITYWNHAAEVGTGLSRDDVIQKDVFEVFPNAAGARLGEMYRFAMNTKKFQSFETCYKDERFEAWYDVRVYPADRGLSVFFQDITEKKRVQRQKEILLEISAAINSTQGLDDLCLQAAGKIATLFEVPSHLIALYLYDARANEILLVAPGAEAGLPQEVMHQVVSLEAPRLAARVASANETVVSDQISAGTVAARFLREMLERRLKTLIVMPLRVQDEIHGVLEVATIKEKEFVESELEILSLVANKLATGISRKRLLDELRAKNAALETQTERTLQASETLKNFLATFSHELRSPLNSIIGYSELLTSQGRDLSPESITEFAKNINASGRHLHHIINDILDLSKIEAGKLELQIASIPVSYFQESIRRLLAPSLAEKDNDLVFEFSPEFEEIVVDQTRFKQVLINLISNAVKFSHRSGRIILRSRRMGNDILFEVLDSGIGIKPEELPDLFKPFRQAASGRDVNRQGIGLGLAIAKKIIDLHGGTIWIESEWGKGTNVSFRIPIVIDASTERILQAGMLLDALRFDNVPAGEGEKPLALIVEDSPQAGEMLQMYVASAGYRVEIARDGMEAVDKAKRLRPSVITLDLMLPVKDGWQVLRELKLHPLCRHIPIIVVSITDEKKLGFSLGAVDYFVKPVQKDELVQALKRVYLVRGVDERQPTVLVIDDDPAATDLIQIILENEGYGVLKASGGKDGVEIAEREQPDLIILDLIMPEESGFNVASRLKQIPSTRSIPIIILTSMDIDAETENRLNRYVSALMSKSTFTKKDLLREIGNV